LSREAIDRMAKEMYAEITGKTMAEIEAEDEGEVT